MRPGTKKFFFFSWFFLTAWLAIRFFLPYAAPFLLALGIALLAEPGVRFLTRRTHLPRAAASGICVSSALLALAAVVTLSCALLLRQLGRAANALPDMEQAAENSLHTLEGGLLQLAEHSPQSVRSLLKTNVSDVFSGGSNLLNEGVRHFLTGAGALLTHIPGSALGLGTAVIAAYLISVRLDSIRCRITARLSRQQILRLLNALHTQKTTLLLWLGAQIKLGTVTFLILCAGMLLLRIRHAIAWALLTAAVDFLPVFGTGTVLLPWSLVSLLQGDGARAAGLAGLYAAAALTRSALEPRLVGAELGLDPLTTLIALYTGFRLWGVGGMLLVPLLTVSAVRLLPEGRNGS